MEVYSPTLIIKKKRKEKKSSYKYFKWLKSTFKSKLEEKKKP